MQGVLHFDRNQDYDMTGSRRLQSFNMTVRRALNTGDKFDIIIDKVFLSLYFLCSLVQWLS